MSVGGTLVAWLLCDACWFDRLILLDVNSGVPSTRATKGQRKQPDDHDDTPAKPAKRRSRFTTVLLDEEDAEEDEEDGAGHFGGGGDDEGDFDGEEEDDGDEDEEDVDGMLGNALGASRNTLDVRDNVLFRWQHGSSYSNIRPAWTQWWRQQGQGRFFARTHATDSDDLGAGSGTQIWPFRLDCGLWFCRFHGLQ